MESLSKDIAHEDIRCAKDTIFTPTTVGIGNISYDDSLVTSWAHQILYSSILYSNLFTWYSGKFGKYEILLNEQVHWRAFKLARK